MWNLKYHTNDIWETNRLTRRTDLVAKVKRDGGTMEWEFGVSRCKLLYIKCTNNKVLLCSAENYIQYPLIKRNGKDYKNVYITEPLLFTAEINTML